MRPINSAPGMSGGFVSFGCNLQDIAVASACAGQRQVDLCPASDKVECRPVACRATLWQCSCHRLLQPEKVRKKQLKQRDGGCVLLQVDNASYGARHDGVPSCQEGVELLSWSRS